MTPRTGREGARPDLSNRLECNGSVFSETARRDPEKPGALNPIQCHVSLVSDTLQFEVARMDKDTALYLRVSHRDQSHASQMPDLERWAEAHDGPVEWFKDTFTGRTMDRPGMDRLLAELRAG